MTTFTRFFSYWLSLLLATAAMTPYYACAECKEFKMVEYEDRVEVVCVGDPPTPAQIKARAEEEKRQDLENSRRKAEEDKRLKDAEVADAKLRDQEEAARKKQEVKPAPPKKPFEKPGFIMQKL